MIQIGKYEFRHKWGLTVILLILLPLGLFLGNWQMDRAEQKQAEIDLRKANTASTPVVLRSGDSDKASMLYRWVTLHGAFDLEHQVLLDNQKHNGTPGYHVFTPARIEGSDTYVMVNRGWVRQGDDRRILPALPGPAARVSIQGRVENVPSVGIKVGEPGESGRLWPKRVIYLDLPWLAEESGYNLLPYVVYQTDGQDFGLSRDWRSVFQAGPRMTPQKHRGYAIQWYSLVVLVLVMYIILSFRKTGSSSGSGV